MFQIFYIAVLVLSLPGTSADYECDDSFLIRRAVKTKTCPRKQDVFCRGSKACATVVDDGSPRDTSAPWTHHPYCALTGGRDDAERRGDDSSTPGPPAGVQGTKFCVFTSSFFGNNGISVITRPEVASTAASSIYEAYNSDFPGVETVQNLNLEPAYAVVDMPDKGGKGVVATRPISSTETVLVDYASLIVDTTTSASLSQAQTARLLRRAADQLLDPFEVLALSSEVAAEGETEVVGRIIKTNNFLHELGDWPQKVLFPLISRINHACVPK